MARRRGPAISPSRMVYVIGTTGDVAQARPNCARCTPATSACIGSRRSAADLEQLAQRLRDTPSTPISAYPDVIQNKVRVKVVALDPATVAVLDAAGRDAIILEEPLLQWLD